MTENKKSLRIKGGIYNYLLAIGQVTQEHVDVAMASFDAFMQMLRTEPRDDTTDNIQ